MFPLLFEENMKLLHISDSSVYFFGALIARYVLAWFHKISSFWNGNCQNIDKCYLMVSKACWAILKPEHCPFNKRVLRENIHHGDLVNKFLKQIFF